ncbi:MAG: hypothetical protein ACK2UW_02835 [Anaerolineales bacterium]|jgi:hypothetical protein
MSLDDFREAGSYIDDDDSTYSGRSARTTRASSGGITPVQRFVLALMLFMMTCLLGAFFLILSGRVVPPGLY